VVASSAGGISGSGSLDMSCIASARSSDRLRGRAGPLVSRMEPKFPAQSKGKALTPSHRLNLRPANLLSARAWTPRGRFFRVERCSETTATTATLPQSARCQEAWHPSIQTVAWPQRTASSCGVEYEGKLLCDTPLSATKGKRTTSADRAETPGLCHFSPWLTCNGKSRKGSDCSTRSDR
jgi:hypothetical protein